nr:serpin family protein [Oriental turtle dovepox virus]
MLNSIIRCYKYRHILFSLSNTIHIKRLLISIPWVYI